MIYGKKNLEQELYSLSRYKAYWRKMLTIPEGQTAEMMSVGCVGEKIIMRNVKSRSSKGYNVDKVVRVVTGDKANKNPDDTKLRPTIQKQILIEVGVIEGKRNKESRRSKGQNVDKVVRKNQDEAPKRSQKYRNKE